MQKNIYLVDDEAVIRKAVSQSLRQLNCRVQTFEDGSSCLDALSDDACDLLITDINMPGMNGLDLIAQARSARPILPVIAITGYGDIQMAVQAMKAGAVDFVEKPLDEKTFMPVVKKALRLMKSQERDPAADTLTDAERRVLYYVAEGKTNKEIAHTLNRSIRTIENHRHRLSKKLGARSTADLVKIAMRLGLSGMGTAKSDQQPA